MERLWVAASFMEVVWDAASSMEVVFGFGIVGFEVDVTQRKQRMHNG